MCICKICRVRLGDDGISQSNRKYAGLELLRGVGSGGAHLPFDSGHPSTPVQIAPDEEGAWRQWRSTKTADAGRDRPMNDLRQHHANPLGQGLSAARAVPDVVAVLRDAHDVARHLQSDAVTAAHVAWALAASRNAAAALHRHGISPEMVLALLEDVFARASARHPAHATATRQAPFQAAELRALMQVAAVAAARTHQSAVDLDILIDVLKRTSHATVGGEVIARAAAAAITKTQHVSHGEQAQDDTQVSSLTPSPVRHSNVMSDGTEERIRALEVQLVSVRQSLQERCSTLAAARSSSASASQSRPGDDNDSSAQTRASVGATANTNMRAKTRANTGANRASASPYRAKSNSSEAASRNNSPRHASGTEHRSSSARHDCRAAARNGSRFRRRQLRAKTLSWRRRHARFVRTRNTGAPSWPRHNSYAFAATHRADRSGNGSGNGLGSSSGKARSFGQPRRDRTDRESAGDDTDLDPTREKKFYLERSDDIVDAPSIGPKTAERLRPARIFTVSDLFDADPEGAAADIGVRHISADTLRDWQDQARLVCTIPWLRGTHAQILVGAGYRTVDQILSADQASVLADILRFSQTSKGQSVLRNGAPPEPDKVEAWLNAADKAEMHRAA